MTSKKKITGNLGEDFAVNFLREKGYEIISRNYRTKLGEIDIVAEDGSILVFVEVKNFQKDSLVNPLEAVTRSKKNKLFRTAQIYLSEKKLFGQDIRFDLVVLKHNLSNQIYFADLFKSIF